MALRLDDMRTITRRLDRSVELCRSSGYVIVRDTNRARLQAVVDRAVSGYLVPYTVPMFTPVLNSGVALRPWIEGVCPPPLDAADECKKTLHSLHQETPTSRVEPDVAKHFLLDRVLNRLSGSGLDEDQVRVCGEIATRAYEAINVSLLTFGAWHGDATLFNMVRTRAGRIVLIDHSDTPMGIQQYDFGKLYASMLFDPINLPVNRVDPYYHAFIVIVIAGMVGNHGAKHPSLVEALVELGNLV